MSGLRIGVLASHNGTTLQSVIDACEGGTLDASVVVVISNNSQSGAAARAARHRVAFAHLSGHTHPTKEALDDGIRETLEKSHVELVLLAGYMKKLGPRTLHTFRGRIVNTHPALLPCFGGEGMYGQNVHQAVLAAGVSTTGVTIHLVDDSYDTGAIVAQREVEVARGDDVETLSRRVQAREKSLLIEVLGDISADRINLSSLTGKPTPI